MEHRRAVRPAAIAAVAQIVLAPVVALTACGTSRHMGAESSAECVRCHGGALDQSGAPPVDAAGRSDPSLRSVGAHATHIAAGFDCDGCHVKPPPHDRSHIDGTVTIAWNALASANGTLTPRYDRSSYACTSVYCHGAFTGGNTSNAPGWTRTGLGDARCGTCHGLPPTAPHIAVPGGGRAAGPGAHPAPGAAPGQVVARSAGGLHVNGRVDAPGHGPVWMDMGSDAFHAFSANLNLAVCMSCHGPDLAGGSSGVGCGRCHDANLPPGVASWAVNCIMCHGGLQNATGAPPKATWGNQADPIRIGAHTAHVSAGELAPAFGCEVCHVKPASALSLGHLDGETAAVVFSGRAVNGMSVAPAWNRATATCSNTYCHGGTMGGTAPAWTSGPGTAGCGTCHGLPPVAPHPAVSGGLAACSVCHPATIDPTGNMIPPGAGGAHLNGLVDAQGHGAEWMDTASAGFHAFSANRNLAACTTCHGADLAGGPSGVGCGQCHDRNLPPGVASWSVNCVMCHGGVQNATGAPPKATWGNQADLVRIGAHTAHVSASSISPAFGCELCHVKPANALSGGHVDGETATVTFGGLAVNGLSVAPAWNRATATCSNTYCHGATMGGAAPAWTSGPGSAACGTCHGLPPAAPHPAVSGGLAACSVCHPATIDPAGNVIPPSAGGAHLNGLVDAQGHGADWMDTASAGFHAFSANRNIAACTGCHGSDLAGGATGVGCGQCHDRNLPAGVASWSVNCVMCHGGVQNTTGAPPKATWGKAADLVRVGAHTAHVSASGISPAFDCGVCHVKPATALAPGHVDAETATVTFGGLAVNGVSVPPAWNRSTATCTNTYCHGATMGGTAPAWTSGPGSAGCGTCHALPPPAPAHPAVSGGLGACATCHPATMTAAGSVIPPSAGGAHLDGIVEAQGHGAAWMDAASTGFHAFAANLDLAGCTSCHGPDLAGGSTGVACADCHNWNLPPGIASWNVNCVMCHGGVENATGAPPKATWGRSGDPIRVGAHTAHVSASEIAPAFGCDVCHVKPASALAPGHVDAPTATVTFGGLAVNGVSIPPAWNRATATCSNTYCHGGTMGGTAPAWTSGPGSAGCGTCHALPPPAPLHPEVSGGLAACATCHPATMTAAGSLIPPSAGGAHLDGLVEAQGHGSAWMDKASTGFHAFAANRNLAACTTCHGPDLAGGSTGVGCGQCHDQSLPPGVASWSVNCIMCHGGVQNTTGAPPKATWGNQADLVRVGAHTAHVSASGISPAFGCEVCHVKPANALSTGHVDAPTATVTFGGLAVNGASIPPAWNRATATCSNTYCHGATMGGAAPAWTSGPGTAGCGTCHGLPPPAPHPAVSGGLGACAVCHPATMTAAGSVIPPSAGGAHLDGLVEAQGHGPAWMDTASTGFHAFSANRNISGCTSCHGSDLSGGPTGVGCGDCHDRNLPPGVASWNVNCVMCHGGVQNATGAPPKATWGKAGDPIRVGAHTAHVSASPISPAFDCVVCHVKPTSALTPGHVDADTATVTFGGLAVNGVSPAPAWNRATASCSNTYCHGATMGGTAPAWTAGPGTAGCGTCHGLPPPAPPHPTVSGGGLAACATCHPATIDAAGNVIPPSAGGAHLNGVVDAQGHGAEWMDTASTGFHAFSANVDLAGCTSCHGPDLAGGSTRVGCGDCHDRNLPPGVPSWSVNCVMCHGGVENATGAPPKATWGKSGDPIRVGAHTAHVVASEIAPGFACAVCHVTPATALSPGHVDAPTATVTFSGLAVNGVGIQPAWSRTTATCSNTYCHTSDGVYPTPVWTQTGLGGYGCNACHLTPPGDTEHRNYHWGLPCSTCHPGATMTSVAPATHVNGVKDVVNPTTGTPWTAGWSDCGPCHTY